METLEKIIMQMHPDRHFHPKQLELFKFVGEKFEQDKDCNTVTVFAARPGCGKSTAIQGFIQKCINEGKGAIVITDSVERLQEHKDIYADDELQGLDDFQRLYFKNRNRITLITKDNKDTEIPRQRYKPILLITTQRYAQMEKSDLIQFLTFVDDNGDKHKRNIIIFDEAPKFFRRVNIGVTELNAMDTALKEGINDLCDKETKDNILFQFRKFSEYLQMKIEQLEYRRDKNTYLYWYDDSRHKTLEDGTDTYSVFDNDTDFLKLFHEYLPSIKIKYPKAELVMRMIFKLIENGGFFVSTKVKANADNKKEYGKTFFVLDNCTEKFKLDPEVKTFIFDGTANIDCRYEGYEGLFEVIDCEDYVVPLDYMTVNLVKCNTSKTALMDQEDSEMKLSLINRYIKSLQLDADDTLFVSYRNLLENNVFAENGLDAINMGHFGGIKGFNHWQDRHNFIQVGLNTFPELEYLLILFEMQSELYDYARHIFTKNVESVIAWFDDLTGHGKREDVTKITYALTSTQINDVRESLITSDMMQNIYRCAARNYDNREPVNLYLVYDYDRLDGITQMLKWELERLGAKFKEHDLPGLKIAKSRARTPAGGNDANAKTQPQLFFDWVESIVDEQKEWKSKDIAKSIGLTTEQLIELKKSNSDVRKILADMKIPHKNLYKKSNLKNGGNFLIINPL